jgi:hypothetical protein
MAQSQDMSSSPQSYPRHEHQLAFTLQLHYNIKWHHKCNIIILLNDSTLCYTNKHITAHITNKLKVTDTRAIFHFRDAIMHTIASRRRRGCHAAHRLTPASPLLPDTTKGWHLLVKLGTVQLFSVAYWRKRINQYFNIFVTNIIWAFMHIYITGMCH